MPSKSKRLILQVITLIFISCFAQYTRAAYDKKNAPLFCPGTQLTNVQVTFSQCGNIATTVTFVVTSVNPVISYSINAGTPQSSPVFSNIPVGSYTLDLIVAPNCAVSFPFTISPPTLPTFVEVSRRDVSCTGNNGVIDFEVAGGSAPYSYFLQYGNGSTYPLSVDSLGGFTPGTYTIIAQDANGCQIDTSLTLLSYTFPVIGQVIETPAECNTNNGSLQIFLANPPVGIYTVNYSINGGFNYQSSNTFNNLAPGTYNVYVTVNGCLSGMGFPLQVVLEEDPGIVLTNVAVTPSNCNGNTGAISLQAVASGDPLLYSINGGNQYQSTGTFTNLSAGSYPVLIQNTVTGCEFDTTIVISTAPAPDITAVQLTPTACNTTNGQLTIQAVSTTPGTLLYSVNNGQTFNSANTFTGLGSGNYTIVVQNQLTGCISDTLITMTTQNGPILSGIQVNDALCVADNGSLVIQAFPPPGGTLSYSIDGGATFVNTSTFFNLSGGTYTISVRNNSNGCVTTTTAFVGAVDTPVINFAVITNPTCTSPTGQLLVNATNPGGGSLQYSINGGLNFQSSPVFPNLTTGNYTVTVINQQNCSASLSVTLLPPNVPVFTSFDIEHASCIGNDGAVNFTVSGGNAPYSYEVEFNGSGIFPIFDDSVSGFTGGTYQFFVEDASGCQIDTTITILSYSFPEISDIIIVQPDCNADNGSVEILISNPPPVQGNYTTVYSIDGGLSYQSSNVFENLAPGQYIVYVAVEGCLSGMGMPYLLNLTENSSISDVTITTTPTDCDAVTGTIGISVTGINGSPSYSIDDGLTFVPNSVFNNLAAGTYAVSVNDPVEGCQFDTLIEITPFPAPVITDIIVTEADCGIDNGQITVLALDPSGMTLSYTIDAGNSFLPTGLFNLLEPGNYTIAVVNEAGCTAAAIAAIQDNSIPVIDAGADVTVCVGSTITLSANASPGSTVTWNNNVLDAVGFLPPVTAPYIATATAINGCSASDTLIVVVNEPVLPELTINVLGTCLPKNAAITVENNNDYTNCNWIASNGYSDNSCGSILIPVAEDGCYDLQLTANDFNGCTVQYTAFDAFCIDPEPVADFNYSPYIVTTEDEVIQFTNTSEYATIFSWELFNNQTSVLENPVVTALLMPGTYPVQLIAYDENGCSDTIVKIIEVEVPFGVYVPNTFTPDGNEYNQVFEPVFSPGYLPSDYNFLIFNRWGEILFESNDPETGWDGTYDGRLVPVGTYTYQLILQSTDDAETVVYRGHVNVIR